MVKAHEIMNYSAIARRLEPMLEQASTLGISMQDIAQSIAVLSGVVPECELCGEARDLTPTLYAGDYFVDRLSHVVWHCADRAGCDERYQAEWALRARLVGYTFD